MRRLVTEANCSFEGAATANALILTTHIGSTPPISHLAQAESFRRAFHHLAYPDQEREAKLNANYTGPICIGQDGGGGYLMCAYGWFDYRRGKPYYLPLAAADLLRDQTAAHGMTLIARAMARAGIQDENVVASCSDGTTHAVQESQGAMAAAHLRGGRVGEQLGIAEFCCIHGKALEEVRGMGAAYPRNFLVEALRLLWEIIGSPIASGGRPDEYRKYWTEPVERKDGIWLPGLPGAFFDQNLDKLPEPTEAKWQVMYDACVVLDPLLVPFGNVLQPRSRRCMLEIFFEKCLVHT